MDPEDDKIKKLKERLEELSQKQESFADEIRELRRDLEASAHTEAAAPAQIREVDQKLSPESPAEKAGTIGEGVPESPPAIRGKFHRNRNEGMIAGVCAGLSDYLQINRGLIRVLFVLFGLLFCVGLAAYLLLWIIMPAAPSYEKKRVSPAPAAPPRGPARESPQYEASRFEKFVGENLLGKLGIVILVIGVSIGAKYSIDNNLISPTVRIILGYLVGVLLILAGLRLRPRYENFSAVLLSGAMAILYFMTYAAYTFYGMYPQWLTFLLMVLITIGTVGISLRYNRQIIAVIGLVGAYCIPFLLSEGRGQAAFLFSYMGIINLGVLFIAFRKYWKPLYLSAFAITWLIVINWYFSAFDRDFQTGLCWAFLIFFFVVFYATFLAYKLLKKEAFNYMDVIVLLLNGFFFYGLGYDLLESSPGTSAYLGGFTFLNACVHGSLAFIIYRNKGGGNPIFYLVSGLALVFLTITVPVQLDGNWVTLLWMAEAVLLFWIGRTRQAGLYENLSYILMILGLFSLAEDWSVALAASSSAETALEYPAFFNPVFLTSLLSSIALGYIVYLFYKEPRFIRWTLETQQGEPLSFAVSGVFLLVLYGSFAMEISNYWSQMYAVQFPADPGRPVTYEANSAYYHVQAFKQVWLVNYSLLFLSILGLVNVYKLKRPSLGQASLILNLLAWFLFMTMGLYQLSELRDYDIEGGTAGIPTGSVGIRYLSLLFLVLLLAVSYKSIKKEYLNFSSPMVSDTILALTVGWVATSELLHWLTLSGISDTYKLWVSVLWGLYALTLVGFGLWRQKRHLRISGIGLFFLTLLKVFFFDLAHLSTLSKTIVFISLGVFLLIVSYLYQRFKTALSEEDSQ